MTLTFDEELPEGITFDDGDIAEDRLSVTFAGIQFEVGVNRLSFTANFDATVDQI